MAAGDDEELRARVVNASHADLEAVWLGAMPDPPAALAADVSAVRSSPMIPKEIAVTGWLYDVETGLIRSEVG
jgi:carbonic anhydrase